MIPTAPAPVASSSRAAPAAARARVPTGSGSGSRAVLSAATNAQLEQMQDQIAETQAVAEGFEKERDFYFESEYSHSLSTRNHLLRLMEWDETRVFWRGG